MGRRWWPARRGATPPQRSMAGYFQPPETRPRWRMYGPTHLITGTETPDNARKRDTPMTDTLPPKEARQDPDDGQIVMPNVDIDGERTNADVLVMPEASAATLWWSLDAHYGAEHRRQVQGYRDREANRDDMIAGLNAQVAALTVERDACRQEVIACGMAAEKWEAIAGERVMVMSKMQQTTAALRDHLADVRKYAQDMEARLTPALETRMTSDEQPVTECIASPCTCPADASLEAADRAIGAMLADHGIDAIADLIRRFRPGLADELATRRTRGTAVLVDTDQAPRWAIPGGYVGSNAGVVEVIDPTDLADLTTKPGARSILTAMAEHYGVAGTRDLLDSVPMLRQAVPSTDWRQVRAATEDQARVLDALIGERRHQADQGYTTDHDDHHALSDFVEYARHRLRNDRSPWTVGDVREAAAVLVAALEAEVRKGLPSDELNP